MPDLNNPPDVSAWTAARSDADTGVAVETPPIVPETPPATPEAPPAILVETPVEPAAPSPAEQAVTALVKGGMTEPEAQKLLESVKTPQPIKDALEAFLDGKPYPVPKSLTFKLKSGATITERSLADLHKGGLLEADYTRKMQQFSQQQREHQRTVAEWTARDAALKEREKWFEEQRQEMLLAQKDPKKWEEYQEIQRLRQQSPAFDKLFLDAMKAREDGAQKAVLDKALENQQVNDSVEQLVDWIDGMHTEYPEVNPERVRVILAFALNSGQLPDTQDSVRKVYEGERAYLSAGPAAQEAAALKARLDALEAEKNAQAHNEKTARVLDRAKAPNLAPAGGGPAAPATIKEPKRIPPDRRLQEDAIAEWSKIRE